MKTLIVATDFSVEAENALEYAGAAAKQLKARIVIFNSYSIPVHAANTLLPASSIENLTAHNKLLLQERATKLSNAYGIEVEFESGLLLEVVDELDALFEKYAASLIVMGMAANSIAQDLFGNTTTSAIMKLKFPVLAIPMETRYKDIKKILFACDVLRGVQNKVLNNIKELATALGAEIEIFHVADRLKKIKKADHYETATRNIGEALEGVTHYYKNVESIAVIKEIEKEIKECNADLLIMIPQKYGFWDSLLHRSKTRMMASNSNVPLLSIPLLTRPDV